MDRAQKKTFVVDLRTRMEDDIQLVVVAHYRGLSVAKMTQLRREMRAEGGEIQVAKNRLVKIALADTQFSTLDDILAGPTALAFSKDPVAAAKVAQKFADSNDNFVIMGGALGDKKLSVADVKALSALPSLDELRSKLVGLIQAPAQQLAILSQAPATKIARVIALKEQVAA